jgi:hypothetical protein
VLPEQTCRGHEEFSKVPRPVADRHWRLLAHLKPSLLLRCTNTLADRTPISARECMYIHNVA